MNIKPQVVERDNRGYWTHSEVPDLGESAPFCVFFDWFARAGVELLLVTAEEDAPPELMDDSDLLCNGNVSQWQPTPPCDQAFLLSIHDTEDGPVSWWGVQ